MDIKTIDYDVWCTLIDDQCLPSRPCLLLGLDYAPGGSIPDITERFLFLLFYEVFPESLGFLNQIFLQTGFFCQKMEVQQ